jgi:phosphopantothenoylcysteine decarboxylase/phosphopantothenate--cysteine ligase
VGQGRLPDLDVIVSEIETIIPQPLKSKTVLVTAGPTREKIDPMRVITNLSSGKTGIEIALEAKRLGAKVKLIAGPGVNIPHEMEFVQYESAVELDECLQLEISKSDPYSSITLVMAAAPADFRPASVSDEKLPHSKDKGINLELIPNPDILKGIAARRKNFPQLEKIVAFAANDKDGLIERASQKLKNKNADYIVANDVKLSANQETTELFLLDKTGLLGSSTKVSKQLAAKWLVKELFQL